MLQASPQQKDINQTIEKILNFYFVTHSIRNKFTKKYTKKKMDKQKEKKRNSESQSFHDKSRHTNNPVFAECL